MLDQQLELTGRELKFAVLKLFKNRGSANKFNVLGRPYQPGDLELALGCRFDSAKRAAAARAFNALVGADLLRATFDSLSDPENCVEITEKGHLALELGVLDHLDEALRGISPELLEIREGAWLALASEGPDSLRQASDSARELIDQVLKRSVDDKEVRAAAWFASAGAREKVVTRRDRARVLMERRGLEFSEESCSLLVDVGDTLARLKHTRRPLYLGEVRDALTAAEIALRAILLDPAQR